ncbi:general odorant-binding protein 70 [Ischnura elegans]|uniref:general odorant-binding protein 70 n=1 Tax=Ischnura elegans TaxID=197161 RepID=UPI001ED87495|nr:general odorant-binding protein 70 [Ischnura elegans]
MSSCRLEFAFAVVLVLLEVVLSQHYPEQQHQDISHTNQKCAQNSASSQKLEKVIDECQDEIKLAILQEALESLQETSPSALKRRERRAIDFSNDEKTIAGCLLQCVYRKVGAADATGFPDPDGLVKFYVDGVEDRGYQGATKIAVHLCTRQASLKRSFNIAAVQQESTDRQRRRLDAEVVSTAGINKPIPDDQAEGIGAQACEEAFDVFQCVTERLAAYCES